MNPKLQRRIQRYGWDKAAQFYEAGWQQSLADVQQHLIGMAAVQPGETVLDIACGTGLVTFPLARQTGPYGHVIATDISDEMVNMVRQQAEAAALSQVTAFRADAEDLSMIDSASVDIVTCALGLMYFPDPKTALREALRVLKPGGRVVVAVWGARRNCGWADIFPIVDARVRSEVCPLFFHLGTGAILGHVIDEAGYSDIALERLQTELAYEDGDAAADAALIGGPAALAYDRFAPEVRDAVRREYVESISGYLTEDGYRIPGEFVVARGFKTKGH